MNLRSIVRAITDNDSVVFSSGDPDSLCYITVSLSSCTVSFTSDVPDYLMSGKLEEAIETLYKRFGAYNFFITVHEHRGELHDKDIKVGIDKCDASRLAEVVKFVMDSFYRTGVWQWKTLDGQ